MFPKILKFMRDDTVAELKHILPEDKRVKTLERGVYEYVSGYYFLGRRIILSLVDIQRLKNKDSIALDSSNLEDK